MKSKRLLLTFAVLGLVISGEVAAVDGYKGVKFGSSFSQLQAGKICSWEKYEADKTPGMDTYYCTNFQFAGKKRTGLAIFIDKKFERISVPLTKDIGFEALADSLKKKYGEPSSVFTQEDIQKAMTDGGEVNVKFDNDTVIISITHDVSTNADTSLLIYTSPDYFEKMNKIQAKALDGDL